MCSFAIGTLKRYKMTGKKVMEDCVETVLHNLF